MTRRETEMVQRFEAGENVASIARRMGISEGVVDQITKRYCFGLGLDANHRRAMMAGSTQLAASINSARAVK